MSVIYHGTPMTPRAALLDVCKGRAMCVSFFRPDDVEAVEAISPAIMFRQRRVLNVEGCTTPRSRMGREMGLVRLLRVAGASFIPSWQVGGHSRHARCAVPAQRQPLAGMALRPKRVAALAHGRTNRAPFATVRQVRPGFSRMDWRGKALGQAGVSRADARGRSGFGQSLADNSHDARDQGGVRLPICQRGRNYTRAEWMAV